MNLFTTSAAFAGLTALAVASPTIALSSAVAITMAKEAPTNTHSTGHNNAKPILHRPHITETSTETHVAMAKKDALTFDDKEKKRYECSNDRTGVLICRYGFCSTDHYCKKGTRCSDRCACCLGVRELAMEDEGFGDAYA